MPETSLQNQERDLALRSDRIALFDNTGPIHPRALEAVLNANDSSVGFSGYGSDEVTVATSGIFNTIFGKSAVSCVVPTGTAANILSCMLLKQGDQILATQCSHLVTMECGGPEKVASVKLFQVAQRDGKLSIDRLEQLSDREISNLRAVHITQPTEYGTVYTIEEMKRIGSFCDKHGLLFGVDGARLLLAAVRLGVEPKDLTTAVGVDYFTFGISKVGGGLGSALILTDMERSSEKSREVGHSFPSKADLYTSAKKIGATLSRSWVVTSQMHALLEDGLWREIASQSLARATQFESGIKSIGLEPLYPVDTNAVFVRIAKEQQDILRERGWHFFSWPGEQPTARFMFPYYISTAQVAGLVADLSLTSTLMESRQRITAVALISNYSTRLPYTPYN